MRIIRLIALLILAANVQAFAQEKHAWKETSAAGYTYRYVSGDPMQARFYTLKNGLTVILSVNKKEPRIQTLIGIRAGSNNDPKSHTGLAHYLEHMLFKGTSQFGSLDWAKEKPLLAQIEKLYDQYNKTTDANARKAIYRKIDSVSGVAARYAIANEYDKMMTGMGAQGTNAHTWVEETVYKEDIPTSAIDKFLTVQAERFREPQFRLFHTELEAVYEEKNRALDSDNSRLFETLLATVYPTHNYGQQTTIGIIDHLKNPSLIAIRKFYNEYYVPNNMAIVFAGDFDPDDLIKRVDKAFSYMKSRPVAEYKGPKEAPITQPVIKEVRGPEAESANIAYRLPGALDTKNAVVAALVSQILSNGQAGLIDLNLNMQQKLLGAGAEMMVWKDYSTLMLMGQGLEGQSLEDVKDLMLSQVDILRKGNFDESLINAIVNNYKLAEINGLENNNNRATSLLDGFIKHRGNDWNHDVAFIEDMSKVTKKQIVDFANTYLANNYVLVYKRQGQESNIEKVEKPAITPIEVNRNAQSAFLQKIAAMPENDVQPMWLDYAKDIRKGQAGKADVFYVQNENNSLFRLYYRFNMGSWNDQKLPLAAQYLQFLGTDKYSSEEISKEFYNIACSFNISASAEETTIAITGLQENFDKAVQLFEHLLRNCKADEQALAGFKGMISKQRADSKLNKGQILNGLRSYAMYGAKNPFNNQLNSADLAAITATDLVKVLHELPAYEHSVIYYGPAPLDQLSASVTRLHQLPATFKTAPAAKAFVKTEQKTGKVYFADYDMVQAEVNWVHNGQVYDPTQTAAVTVFNNYFGGGMGSIVFQTIRESKALAYSTYAVYGAPSKKNDRYSGIAYVGCQADKLNEAIGGMNDLLTVLPESEKSFETALASTRKDIATERITQEKIVFSYLAAQKLGLDTDIRRNVYNSLDKLSFADLQKLYAGEIAKKPYTYCIVASEKNVKPDALKQYGDVQKVSLEEIFGY